MEMLSLNLIDLPFPKMRSVEDWTYFLGDLNYFFVTNILLICWYSFLYLSIFYKAMLIALVS
jgi:hypothetical protein